jgi:ABC-type sugar transport system ATPase subunit
VAGLTLRNITKRFGDTVVLDDISLELDAGELLVLLGPSGCGKSTLLRIIAGLETPDSGEIYVDDRRIDRLPPRKRNVSMVFQNYSLYPHMTVEKNLAFPLKIAGVSRKDRDERVFAVADLLGLADRLHDRPGKLSGGQRQRVALGRAIIRDPSVFLLDEPLSNLDADLRMKMRKEIVRLQKQLERTMIHVTHDQTEALTMADRIGLLYGGKLQQVGTPQDLYEQPSNRLVAEFIGQPKINFIEAVLQDGHTVPLGIQWPPGVELSDFTVVVGIRPDLIRIAGDGEFTGEVVACEYLGEHYIASLRFKGQLINVSGMTSRLNPGDNVKFNIDKNRLLFFDSATQYRVVLSGSD